MTLREAIAKVVGQRSLTYRQITEAINEDRLYIPRDGTLVPQAQARAAVRESAKYFDIDRAVSLYRVTLRV